MSRTQTEPAATHEQETSFQAPRTSTNPPIREPTSHFGGGSSRSPSTEDEDGTIRPQAPRSRSPPRQRIPRPPGFPQRNPLYGSITPGASISASLGSLSVPPRTTTGLPYTAYPEGSPSGSPGDPGGPGGGSGPGDARGFRQYGDPGRPGGGRDPEGGGGGPPGPGGPPGGQGPPQPQQPAQNQTERQGKGKIRDPTIFTGDREQTQTFLNSLFLLFFGRPNDFITDAVKISSALSYMEGAEVEAFKESIILNAQRIDPYTGMQQGFGSWNEFEQLFRTTFAPINEVDNAIMELGSIQYNQYKTPDDFHARFLKLLMVCRITEPLVQISYYRAALNDTLRNRLANSYPMPVTLEQYMTRVLEMDHAWRANRHLSQLQRKGRSTGGTDKAARATDTTQKDNQTNKLSLAKRQELRKKGLCFFCQKEGHVAKDCPNRVQDQSKKTFRRNARPVETNTTEEGEDEETQKVEDDPPEEEIYEVDLVTTSTLQNFQ